MQATKVPAVAHAASSAEGKRGEALSREKGSLETCAHGSVASSAAPLRTPPLAGQFSTSAALRQGIGAADDPPLLAEEALSLGPRLETDSPVTTLSTREGKERRQNVAADRAQLCARSPTINATFDDYAEAAGKGVVTGPPALPCPPYLSPAASSAVVPPDARAPTPPGATGTDSSCGGGISSPVSSKVSPSGPRPLARRSGLCSAKPEGAGGSIGLTVTAGELKKRTLPDTRHARAAADGQKEMMATATTRGPNVARSNMKITPSCRVEAAAPEFPSLARDKPDSSVDAETTSSPPHVLPASSVETYKCSPVPALLDPASSGGLLLPLSEVREPLESFASTGKCQSFASPAIAVKLPHDFEAGPDRRTREQIFQPPSLKGVKLNKRPPSLPATTTEAVGCTTHREIAEAGPKAPLVEVDRVRVRTATAGGDSSALEDKRARHDEITRSRSTLQAAREPSALPAVTHETQEQSSLPTPTAAAETPSTVSSSDSSGAGRASCSPVSSFPPLNTCSFHPSGVPSTADRSPAAQHCRGKALSPCSLPVNDFLSGPAPSTGRSSATVLSSFPSIPSAPPAGAAVTSLLKNRSAFETAEQRPAIMHAPYEGAVSVDGELAEAKSFQAHPETAIPSFAPGPLSPAVGTVGVQLGQPAPGTISGGTGQLMTVSRRHESSASGNQSEAALGADVSTPKGSAVYATARNDRPQRAGRPRSCARVFSEGTACSGGADASTRCESLEHHSAHAFPGSQNNERTREFLTQASGVASPFGPFARRSLLPPTARSVCRGSREPEVAGSLMPVESSDSERRLSNKAMKVGYPVAALESPTDAAVRRGPPAVGKLSMGAAVSPTDTRVERQARGPGVPACVEADLTVRGGVAVDRSFLGEQRHASRIHPAAGTGNIACDSKSQRGGDSSASSLEIRCLLAASLRTIFKMLIKSVRSQRRQHLLERCRRAPLQKTEGEVNGSAARAAKRRRLEENVSRCTQVCGASRHTDAVVPLCWSGVSHAICKQKAGPAGAGVTARLPLCSTDISNGRPVLCDTAAPKWTQAETLPRQSAACKGAARPGSTPENLGEPTRDARERLCVLVRQQVAWVAAARVLQSNSVLQGAQHDAATILSEPRFRGAGCSIPDAGASQAPFYAEGTAANLNGDEPWGAAAFRPPQSADGAERSHVAASFTACRCSAGPYRAGPLLFSVGEPCMPSVPKAGAAASCAPGVQTKAATAAEKDDKLQISRRENSPGIRRACVERLSVCKRRDVTARTALPRRTERLLASYMPAPPGGGRCPLLIPFTATRNSQRPWRRGGPRCCGVGEGRSCPGGATRVSLQEAAAFAEHQLLAAYRECFLLLCAAERREDLTFFELVLLGGSWRSKAASSRELNKARASVSRSHGAGGQQRPVSHQAARGVQAVEDATAHSRAGLHKDTDADSLPETASLVNTLPCGKEPAVETACPPSTPRPCAEEGGHRKCTQENVHAESRPGSAKLYPLPESTLDAAEATWKRLRQLALRPGKWAAKKIHYVLAALDGLRDAWRQGSTSTRAKARVLESIFTPLSQQLRLTQHVQTRGSVQLPNSRHNMPLQKYFHCRQTLDLSTQAAPPDGGTPLTCSKTLPSSFQDAKATKCPVTAGQSLPSHPGARSLTGSGNGPVLRTCLKKKRRFLSRCTDGADCGGWSVSTCCGGLHVGPHTFAHSRGNSCRCPRMYLPAHYTSAKLTSAVSEGLQKKPAACDAEGGGAEDSRATVATRRPCRWHTRPVTPVASSCRLPNQDTEQQLLVKSCDISPRKCRQQAAGHQHGPCWLRRSNAVTGSGSVTVADAAGLEDESTSCSRGCSSGERPQQPASDQPRFAYTVCDKAADSFEPKVCGPSPGEERTAAAHVIELRQGEERTSPQGSLDLNHGADVYRKPRPPLASWRVLLQRHPQGKKSRSTLRAARQGISDVDVASSSASSTQRKRELVMVASRHPGETDAVSPAEAPQAECVYTGLKEGGLLGTREDNVAASKREREITKAGGRRDGVRLRVDGDSSDTPLGGPSTALRRQFTYTFAPEPCRLGELKVEHDAGRKDYLVVSKKARSPRAATACVTTGDTLPHTTSTSASLLTARPVLAASQVSAEPGNNATQNDAEKHEDVCPVVPPDGALTPVARTALGTPTAALQLQQAHSVSLNAQAYADSSSEGVCRLSRSSRDEGPTTCVPKEKLPATRAEGSVTNTSSQQNTAAMRTARHNKTKQPGVFQFTRGPKRFWAASWYADGHPGWKAFSVEKWGNREAFERARRAYEEKAPRNCRDGGPAANDCHEGAVSSERLACRPARPEAHTSPARRRADGGAAGASSFTRSAAGQGGRNKLSNDSETRASTNTAAAAKRLALSSAAPLPAGAQPADEQTFRLPVLEVAAAHPNFADLLNSASCTGDLSNQRTVGPETDDLRGSTPLRTDSPKTRLLAEVEKDLFTALSAQAAFRETASQQPTQKEERNLGGSPHPAAFKLESAAATGLKTLTQSILEEDLAGGELSPAHCTALLDCGIAGSLLYNRDPQHPGTVAKSTGLDGAHGQFSAEVWSSYSKGAGVLPRGAAFSVKDLSPSARDSSSNSCSFGVIDPSFPESPLSIFHVHKSFRGQHPEQRGQGLEELLLSSAPLASAAQGCTETANERQGSTLEADAFPRSRQTHKSDTEGLPETGLAPDAYGLLSPSAFFPASP